MIDSTYTRCIDVRMYFIDFMFLNKYLFLMYV